MEMYTQCRLMRGARHQVAWIPMEAAVDGRCVDLKLGEGRFDRGWVVERAYGAPLPMDYVRERERDFVRTRRASDI